MSDPDPSVPACPPSPPAAQVSDALSYAFLVHSQKTLTQNLPPRVDNKLLARQKRRRTRYDILLAFPSLSVNVWGPVMWLAWFVSMANPRRLFACYSPEDHAILEAEYQRDPKPDKTARADIVSRVTLGEKEVQVCHILLEKYDVCTCVRMLALF